MTAENLQRPNLVQCSVTGKMVPEDEIVTIQGHRVCAEGKAILLERLKSGEALPGEREKPTVLRRFGCIFVDGLILGVPIALINFGLGAATGGSQLTLGAFSIFAVLLEIVYFGQMHGTKGQTVGKMAGKLVVVNLDGSPVTLGTAYLRAVAYIGPSALSGLAMMTGNALLVGVASLAVLGWGLANIICALVDRTRQRALHDRIAGTRVVEKE